jgi:uncharacterized protein (DUF2062 family)
VPNPLPSVSRQPTFWQHRVINPIIAQLTQGITPEKMALTLAVGSACAVFPILGTTTILCLVVGIVLRLNQVAIQVVNLLCSPIHIALIYVYLRIGAWIFHIPHVHVPIRLLSDQFMENPLRFFERFGEAAYHAIVAWAIFAAVWSIGVYFLALPVLREIARRRAIAAANFDETAPPPEHPVP